MNDAPLSLEQLWFDLLSRQPELIKTAFLSLEPADQKTVYTHLEHMAIEAGWQPEQRESAETALRTLKDLSKLEE